MRLFLPQAVGTEEPMTPPFLTDREDDNRLALLRESTAHIKEGKSRLPTPEKKAIMQLSTSFEKRRLGKQQQILSEMTQRCRVQEVTDLSIKMSAKCDLNAQGRGLHLNTARDNTFYSTNSLMRPNKRPSDVGHLEAKGSGDSSRNGSSRKVNAEKSYKFFPARHIMRQQTKTSLLITNPSKMPPPINIPKNLRKSTEFYMDTQRSQRLDTLFHQTLDRDREHDNAMFIPKQSFDQPIVPKTDNLAPLVLPRLGLVSLGYNRDRVDSYMSSNRLASGPRIKHYIDSNSSVGGRSLNSFQLNHHSKTDKVDHSLVNIHQMAEDDMTSIGSVVGRGFGQSVDNLIS